MPVFLISLPIFLIIFAGWILRKYKIVKNDWIHVLNHYAYYIALPALIVSGFWNVDFTKQESWLMVYFSVAATVLFCALVLSILSFVRIRTAAKAAIFLSATVGNTIYMANPVAEMVYGGNSLSQATLIGVILLVLPILLSIFVIKYWHNREYRAGKQFIAFLKNPLVVSTAAGIALSFVETDFGVISSLRKAIVMVGGTAAPVALFALGGFLCGKFMKTNLKEVISASFLKLVAFPAFVYAFLWFFMKAGNLELYMLLASMPAAVTTFIIAEEFDLEKELVGNTILVSTILSFFVIPAIIYLF